MNEKKDFTDFTNEDLEVIRRDIWKAAAAVQAALSASENIEADGTPDKAVLQRIALDYLNKADEYIEPFV